MPTELGLCPDSTGRGICLHLCVTAQSLISFYFTPHSHTICLSLLYANTSHTPTRALVLVLWDAGYEDARGDQCDLCGKPLDATKLIRCVYLRL